MVNMTFNDIDDNKFPAKVSEFTVCLYGCSLNVNRISTKIPGAGPKSYKEKIKCL